MACGFLYYLGLATATVIAARFCVWFARTFIIKSSLMSRVVVKNADNWALVTGCTGGIGEGFAAELARRKLNIILVSRSQDKLSKQASELESKYKIRTKTLAIDFGAEDTNTYTRKLQQCLAELPESSRLAVLVNNVGVNYEEMPNKFLEVTQREQDQMVKINVEVTMNVTRVCLARMVKSSSAKQPTLVVNVGSYVAGMPVPMLSVYDGTKSFVEAWSRALAAEYKSQGVEVVAVSPMYVVSAMSGFRKPSLTVASQHRMARDTLDQSGTILTPYQWSPYFAHAALIFFQTLIPERILAGIQMNAMKGVRARIIRKKEAKQAPAATKSE